METINRKFFGVSVLFAALSGSCFADPTSSYAGQEARELKALLPEDVQSYLAGKGMGMAKAAELNGYPGPAHVLSLAEALVLTPEQKERTTALFKAMETRAIALGQTLIEKEKQLDMAFAEKSVDRSSLERMLQQIAATQAQLRLAHLDAHLQQVRILSLEQIARYNDLRGYGKPTSPTPHAGHAP
ncbi:Spy/CpxP family protein refolding chaperone [Oxalobacteraceae bacterium R-40]|uniref:Spy/CpxP family protein refolding chaperone n=1 Tax=Keguizhuia sedimenti TaxID=3064264 RepID=A0ABU1BLH4_9BURK|nr:Spy/CpxP family protein refolding chaperone [Oxalobacteraceae bacterium R-40]